MIRASLIIFPILLYYLITLLPVSAESLTVSLQVGTTEVHFSGYTSPNSYVAVKENSTILATTTSDSNGDWSIDVNIALPDIHTYTLYSTDQNSLTSASVEYTLNVAGNTTTSVDNIVLPPTSSLSGSTISGSTHPSASLTLLVSTGPSYTINPAGDGTWSYNLSSLPVGTHSLTLTATIPPSYISLESTPLIYVASAATPASSAEPNSSPSPTPSPSTSPATSAEPDSSPRPFFVTLYDQDGDGKITTPELFETVKAWLQKTLVCDLNHDGFCNLFDLSILLYYIDR